MIIGNKLSQLRKLSGMTQEQLAEKINVSRQTVSKWESDSTSPDLESIVKISWIFHVSLDDLLKEAETGVIGIVLFISYVIENRKKRSVLRSKNPVQ